MIKVRDIAYVRFAAPDLDAMERFVNDFGLVVTAREDGVIYSRGTDPSPYVHVTERGDAGFRAVAFEAALGDDKGDAPLLSVWRCSTAFVTIFWTISAGRRGFLLAAFGTPDAGPARRLVSASADSTGGSGVVGAVLRGDARACSAACIGYHPVEWSEAGACCPEDET